ncbi:PH domain-containing protein [Mycoplasmatota bacterium]|nr:PH domain-containing protein [Mycoplasmatota bacterium]
MTDKYHIAKRKYIYDVFKSLFFSIFLVFFISPHILETENEEIFSLSNIQAIIVLLIFFLSLITQFIIYWMIYKRHLFSNQDKSFLIEKGLFFKRKINLPYKNIHTISIKRNLFDMILGLSKLQIDTGTTASMMPEAHLTLDKTYAPVLKKHIEDRIKLKDVEIPSPVDFLANEEENNDYFYQLKWYNLIGMGIIKPGFLSALGVLTLILFGFIMTFLGLDSTINLTAAFLTILLSFGGLSILLVIGLSLYHLIRYWNFRITIEDKHIMYQYGLINRVEFKLATSKINAVHIKRSILYRLLNYYELNISVLGIGDQNQDNQIKIETKAILPLVKFDILSEFLNHIDYQTQEEKENIKPKTYSKLNFVILPTIILLIVAITPHLFGFFDYSKLISPMIVQFLSLILIIIALYLRLKNHHYTISNNQFIFQRQPFTIKKTIIKRHRIQSISYKQTPILLIEGIGNIGIKYKDLKGNITMRSYPKSDFDELKNKLLTKD